MTCNLINRSRIDFCAKKTEDPMRQFWTLSTILGHRLLFINFDGNFSKMHYMNNFLINDTINWQKQLFYLVLKYFPTILYLHYPLEHVFVYTEKNSWSYISQFSIKVGAYGKVRSYSVSIIICDVLNVQEWIKVK